MWSLLSWRCRYTCASSQGVWGLMVCGGWRSWMQRKGTKCSPSPVRLWHLGVLLHNTVWMFEFSQYALRRNMSTLCLSSRRNNCLFSLGVWDQQRKALTVLGFVMPTGTRKGTSPRGLLWLWYRRSLLCQLYNSGLMFPLEK